MPNNTYLNILSDNNSSLKIENNESGFDDRYKKPTLIKKNSKNKYK
jgi:hypothetical protein